MVAITLEHLPGYRAAIMQHYERELAMNIRNYLLSGVCFAPETEQGSAPVIKSAAIINDSEKAAISAANELAKNDQFTTDAEAFLTAGEVVKMGPLTLFLSIYVNDADLLSSLPVPETKTGNNPEMIKVSRPSAKGGTTDKTVSFYTVMADNHPIGKKIQNTIDDLKRRNDNGTLGDVSFARDNSKWTARKTAFRTVVKKMAKLYHQFDAISNLDLVTAAPAKIEQVGPDGKAHEVYAMGAEPIMLSSKSNAQDFKTMSVETFLRIKVDEAIAMAGKPEGVTKAHLMKTLDRETGQAKGAIAITDKTREGVASSLWNYLDKEMGGVAAAIHKRDAEGNALLLVLNDLHHMLDNLLGPEDTALRVLLDQRQAKADAEKAAKLKAAA